MHQLQSYAALYASMSSQSSMGSHLQVPNGQGRQSSSSSPSPNGYHPPLPSPGSQQAHPLQMLSPNGMLSPVSMQPSPLSPFFMYPNQAAAPQHQQQQQSQAMQGQPQRNTNLYSMLFPLATPGGSSLSGSGTSSVESLSPDSSPMPSIMLDRGRRRTRTRTANARMGGGGVGGGGEDEQEEGVGDDEGGDQEESDDDDDCGFSEALADAILKRPGSIRVGSKKKKNTIEKQAEVEKHTEFTFPSLSDFGIVYNDRQRSRGGGDPAVVAEESAHVHEDQYPKEENDEIVSPTNQDNSGSHETTPQQEEPSVNVQEPMS